MPGAPHLEDDAHRHELQLRQPPVRVVREEERLPVGVEAQRLETSLADALEDEVDVRAPALDHLQVHQDEEDVVVGGHQVRARGGRAQDGSAEVLGDTVAAAVEDRPAAEIVWGNKPQHGVSPINVQPIVVDGTMYGFDESGWLYAVEIPSGRRLWQGTEPVSAGRPAGSGTAFIVRHGDTGNRFWLFNDSGDLVIAQMNRDGYKELGKFHILEPTSDAFGRPVVWSHPAFADRCVFARNDKEIVCVLLAAP